MSELGAALRRLSGRVGTWFLALNVVVLLVPVAGIEFARIYERQLLASLERDMRNQSALVRALLEARAEDPEAHAVELEGVLRRAARSTRTRVRVLDAQGELVADSHRDGPPEGEEPAPPSVVPVGAQELGRLADDVLRPDARSGPAWPPVALRPEVLEARAGRLSTATRVRGRSPGVLLFLAEPVLSQGSVAGVVYVTRSTQPVLVELYRIRSGLVELLAVALVLSASVTLLLGGLVSRPLSRLVVAARRIGEGQLAVPIPVEGRGELRELAAALAAMKERLAARLRFASEFSADVAHELKSPLTSIRGAAELLSEGAFDDAEARRTFLRNIQLDVDRLDGLVVRLLQLGRIEASEEPLSELDLAALAAEVAERHRERGQAIEVSLPRRPLRVLGRAEDLATALSNLLDNAARYAPAGEPVALRLGAGEAGRVELAVLDRGPGVSAGNRARVFERFFTTQAEHGGTGLGLAIVRSVAEAHGGQVRYEDREGGGACFVFSLPALGA